MATSTEAADQRHLIFVYGTLKLGQPNDFRMPEESTGFAKLVGLAVTEAKWPLVIASRYNIPFLLYHEGHGKVIRFSFLLAFVNYYVVILILFF